MSNDGDKNCPLCAEEMDLTDQQLKPCKCGYEICIWCWHQIMDMAEKNMTEGLCPACRTPYNKERIVGSAENRGKLVVGASIKKKKLYKGKSKTSEDRKQLGNMRVILKNLVCVMGLPLDLADEDLLQRKQYFGQYGKVQRVSISRNTAGTIQQNANYTCSVYVTYSKEDEAVSCIDAVNGFVLEGRPLRAYFGTTKYCYAWLRNVPCRNSDCPYLHEIASQEDSFSKDETELPFPRNGGQQIAGATDFTQHRSGDVLPPPADEYCNSGAAASTGNISPNSATNVRGCPPSSRNEISVGLPSDALWSTHGSSNYSHSPTLTSSNGQPQQIVDARNSPVTFSAAVLKQNHASSIQSDEAKNHLNAGEVLGSVKKSRLETLECVKTKMHTDEQTNTSESTVKLVPPLTSSVNSQLLPESKDVKCLWSLKTDTTSIDPAKAGEPTLQKESEHCTERNVQNLCSDSDLSSVNIVQYEGLWKECEDQPGEPISYQGTNKSAAFVDLTSVTEEEANSRLLGGSQELQPTHNEKYDDVIAFNSQRLNDPEVVTGGTYLQNPSQFFSSSNYSSNYSLVNDGVGSIALGVNELQVDNKKASNIPGIFNGHIDNQVKKYNGVAYGLEHFFPDEDKLLHTISFGGSTNICDSAEDMLESNIVSRILSQDFDPWNESLGLPHNFMKMLGDNDNEQCARMSPYGKVHPSNQSRFSFAREDDRLSKKPNGELYVSQCGHTTQNDHFSHDLMNDASTSFDKQITRKKLSLIDANDADYHAEIHSYSSSNGPPVSRSRVSGPPGFSAPNMAPPPGFTSRERVDKSLDTLPWDKSVNPSSLFRNQYQASTAENIVCNGDIEFIDPAILAIGKGILPVGLNISRLDSNSSFTPHYGTYEDEVSLQLMRRSMPPDQNQRYTNMGNNFTHLQDLGGAPPLKEHTSTNNISPFSQLDFANARSDVTTNGHWKGLNGSRRGNDSSWQRYS